LEDVVCLLIRLGNCFVGYPVDFEDLAPNFDHQFFVLLFFVWIEIRRIKEVVAFPETIQVVYSVSRQDQVQVLITLTVHLKSHVRSLLKRLWCIFSVGNDQVCRRTVQRLGFISNKVFLKS